MIILNLSQKEYSWSEVQRMPLWGLRYMDGSVETPQTTPKHPKPPQNTPNHPKTPIYHSKPPQITHLQPNTTNLPPQTSQKPGKIAYQ